MKLKYYVGDLLLSSCPLIIHGVNAQGVMGSGIAKSIRLMYPEVFSIYRKKYELNQLKLGEVIYVKTKRYWIANGVTQKNYGRFKKQYVDYEAINKIMLNVNNFSKNKNINQVGMPLIGAGLGGGSWEIIAKIIEECLTDVQPIVYVLSENDIPKE